MKKKRTVLFLIITCVLTMSVIGVAMYNNPFSASAEKKSENLIVLIGDGMGPPQVTLSRIYGQKYEDMEKLHMDDYLVGTNSTKSEQGLDGGDSGVITDSAASGTAFATGNKTYNGAISVTNEQVAKPVASVLEAAQAADKGTGLISTARITHATPAVYASHVRDRDNENAIASQYLNAGIDVLIGGGERHFVGEEKEAQFGESEREDGKDLVGSFEEKGYSLAYNKKELQDAEGDKLLALLSDSHVPYQLDRDKTIPSLKEQLEKAIQVLEKNEEGFVLMIEGGRIDHGGHSNDIHSVVQELLEFDEAFQTAVDYAKESGDTSVIATADHETGGLTIGSNNISEVYSDVFKNVTASSETIGKELLEAKTEKEVTKIVEEYTEIKDLSKKEIKKLMDGQLNDGTKSIEERESAFNEIIAKRSNIGWTGHGHTGVDVGVYGYGPAAELLTGFNDNTDFAKAGATALGLDLEKATNKLQEKYAYPVYEVTEDGELLFPVNQLESLLGIHVKEANNGVDVSGNDVTFSVKKDAKEVKAEEETYEVLTKEDNLYIPFELLQILTNQEITWDELSERIVME